MAGIMKAALLVGAAVATTLQQHEAASITANPIRRVVSLLQDMQKKVTEEGKKDQALFDKFMCYCSTNGADLAKSVEAAEAKIEGTSSALQGSGERKTQTEADLKEHRASRSDAEEMMKKAKALRDKEAVSFAKESSDLRTNIDAITKAVEALEKGMMGSFLQTPAAIVVRRVAVEHATLPDATRQEILAFLSSTGSQGYVPQSQEIVGILKQMGDEMKKDLQDSTDTENSAIANHEGLIAAKKKEVATLQAQIETEMERIGRLGVENAEMANDIEDTKGALAADRQLKQELEKGCDTKKAEFEEIKKIRVQELLALSETIKVLNDDDSLELFKRVLPSTSSSFVQVQTNDEAQRSRARQLIRTAARHAKSPALDTILLALRGKKGGFEKVITMIDQMVANLKEEQGGDDSKKGYCEKQLDESDDHRKELDQSLSDSEAAIDEMKGLLSSLVEEINALRAGIKALDKSVAQATEQRHSENEAYKALIAADSTAKKVLDWAKNRLNKFYHPGMYKAPEARKLTEEERVTVNMGGTVAAKKGPGGIAGTGIPMVFVEIGSHSQAHRDAPPQPFGAYAKKSEETNGVMAMIDLLIKDLDKEMQQAGVDEKDAQADYEQLMADAAEKRAADLTSLNQKQAAKASAEEQLDAEEDNKAGTTEELMHTLKYIKGVHDECDWLLKYYEARREARTSEVDSLKNAKAVLSGADLSLVQVAHVGFLARRRQ